MQDSAAEAPARSRKKSVPVKGGAGRRLVEPPPPPAAVALEADRAAGEADSQEADAGEADKATKRRKLLSTATTAATVPAAATARTVEAIALEYYQNIGESAGSGAESRILSSAQREGDASNRLAAVKARALRALC